MKQKMNQRLIYKLPSSFLQKAGWNLELPLATALKEYSEYIVPIGSSQALRFIDELNDVSDINERITDIKIKIKKEKKKPRTANTNATITYLYKKLYELQFQPDYMCVVMERKSDYDRANRGFTVNGIKYRRLLGTNGGIKNSTIVYVNEKLYPELKRRLDNGRDMSKPLVPAKLETYQALVCSGSTALPQPDGVIVVNDCITHFKDNVILINDETEGEPLLKEMDDYEIEHNDSDGYGLMSPAYSRRVNHFLTGKDETIAGMNTRWAWTKGMVYTFDFVEFGRDVANTFYIRDAWGDLRDVRCADVILTTSMLKLWDSYHNWEDYYSNCRKNHYLFSAAKITPKKLEHVRNTNYQFLQSYDLTDSELSELCKPTIDELKDVLGMDYRKSLVFMAGYGLDAESVLVKEYDYCAKALMIDKRMINDPFVRKKIWNMISKRIEMGKRGAIKINANYAMISGDPYALCQSMFGLEVTGLLKAGELYHKYWSDKGATELACFRAPMTCHNNIRKMKLLNTADAQYWYQYITTVAIFNAWDTACDAMNGADKDGDTNMDTDNPILVRNTRNAKTIVCVQRKAEKTIPAESDIIVANKLAFNDDIGKVTNDVTSMIERQAGFSVGSDEYKELGYRIMCGQLYQQNTIDRAKGIIAKPMPAYWYNTAKCMIHEDDSDLVIRRKQKDQKIVAAHKPYFMTYVYPQLRKKNNDYIKNNDYGVTLRFKKYGVRSIKELYEYHPKTPEMISYLDYFEKYKPVGNNPCVVNRISWLFEKEFDGYLSAKYIQPEFDYSILKSGVGYTKSAYKRVEEIFKAYLKEFDVCKKNQISSKDDPEQNNSYHLFIDKFRMMCAGVCSNEDELCDIVLDICYCSTRLKQFAWDICGDTIINNLLKRNDYTLNIPVLSDESDYDFEYHGDYFKMTDVKYIMEDFDD